MDDDIRDKQLEEQTRPLAMRLFQSTTAAKENDKKSVSKTEQLNAQLTKIVSVNDQEEQKQAPERQFFDEFDQMQQEILNSGGNGCGSNQDE